MIILMKIRMMIVKMMMNAYDDADMIGITGERMKKFFYIYNVYNAM